MTSLFSKFTRKSGPRLPDDDEKAAAYEDDRSRLTKSSPQMRTGRFRRSPGTTAQQKYSGSFAPNPIFIRLLRFLMYGLTSLSALVTAALGCAIVHYYNTVGPVIKPSWGSLIACIVFGFGTPGVLFFTFFISPHLTRVGTFTNVINTTKVEILIVFTVAAVWISGAIALACDLRGTEFCLWDGFYHYPKPSDYGDVCRLRNVMVALAYTTFGLAAFQLVVLFFIVAYILLFLDQEALSEQTNDLGGRAYRARLAALAEHRASRNADMSEVSTAGPFAGGVSSTGGPMAGGVPTSRQLPTGTGAESSGGGPMMANSRNSGSTVAGARPHSREQYDPEDMERGSSRSVPRHNTDHETAGGDGYYSYETGNRADHTRV